MPVAPDFRRLPIESSGPVVLFAIARARRSCSSRIALCLALGFPFEGELVGLLAGLALPWSVGVLVLALRRPELAQHPLVAAGDFVVLGRASRWSCRRSTRCTASPRCSSWPCTPTSRASGAAWPSPPAASALLIGARAIADEGPVSGDLLILYESLLRGGRAGKRLADRPAAHDRVGVARAGARAHQANPARGERGAPPRGRVDPRRARAGADRPGHDARRREPGGGAGRPATARWS